MIPMIFNYSTSVKPGDIFNLQGAFFGANPTVKLASAPVGQVLTIVNGLGTNALSVQLPNLPPGVIKVRVWNSDGGSAILFLNAAIATHLDAIDLVPGGKFRVFGKNLITPGATPTVKIDGRLASIDRTASNENVLLCTVAANQPATSSSTVIVANGNGSGPYTLTRPARVLNIQGAGDPFGLGVGWGAGFSMIARNIIYAASDSRLGTKVVANNSQDDGPAINAAINLAASTGGGIVQLPAGNMLINTVLDIKSSVVLRGAGIDKSVLNVKLNYYLYIQGRDWAGACEFTANQSTSTESLTINHNTHVFLKNVKINKTASFQAYLQSNTHFVVDGCEMNQLASSNGHGPWYLGDNVGLVFQRNKINWGIGASQFTHCSDSALLNNVFTRNTSQAMIADSTSTVHGAAIDFAHHISLVGNSFLTTDVITNHSRNDGEMIISEGGGGARTENLGTATSATSTTLTDTNNTINVDPFSTGIVPENYGVAIVSGTGMGQTRKVTSYSGKTLTVSSAWDVTPDSTSKYITAVWTTESVLILNNTMSQNTRGVWIYQGAARNVDIVGNTFTNNGGIYLRTAQNLATKAFLPHFNMKVTNNTATNTTNVWPAYINHHFVNQDGGAFGTSMIGLEMSDNVVNCHNPNLQVAGEEYADHDGLTVKMRVERYDVYTPYTPRIMSPILQRNTVNNAVGVELATGVSNAVLSKNNPNNFTNDRTIDGSFGDERATGTVQLS